jgi:hypothetical protein
LSKESALLALSVRDSQQALVGNARPGLCGYCLIIRPRATRHLAPLIAPLYPTVQGITDTTRKPRSLLIGAPIPHERRRCPAYTLFRHM